VPDSSACSPAMSTAPGVSRQIKVLRCTRGWASAPATREDATRAPVTGSDIRAVASLMVVASQLPSWGIATASMAVISARMGVRRRAVGFQQAEPFVDIAGLWQRVCVLIG
jgi:hypothetical protein